MGGVWMDGWMGGCLDGCVDGWLDEWMDGFSVIFSVLLLIAEFMQTFDAQPADVFVIICCAMFSSLNIKHYFCYVWAILVTPLMESSPEFCSCYSPGHRVMTLCVVAARVRALGCSEIVV